MNICYISHVDISLPNGPGVNEREFLQTLKKESSLRGYRASCIIPKPSLPLEISLPDAHFFEVSPPVTRFALLNRIFGNIKPAFLIIWLTLKNDFDLFILRLSRTGIFIPLLLLLLRRPYCIKTLGNVRKFDASANGSRMAFKERPLLFLFNKILKNSVIIDVCTPQLEKVYRSGFGLNNIHVVDNAVNIEHFYPLPKDECRKKCGLEAFDRIVGYCGGKPSQRGARQLIEISRQLFARYHNAGIVIIGEDENLNALKDRAREYGLSERILFTGTIDYTELNQYLNCLDVGVAFDEARRIDLIGNSSQKIRQYIACGVPVICPRNTNEELIEQNLGTGVSSEDIEQLFRDICHWFDLTMEHRETFREKARAFAVKNLSCEVAYEKRYRAWEKALYEQHTDDNEKTKTV